MKAKLYWLLPACIVIISGMGKGLSDRLEFHQKTIPEFMHNSFWLQHGNTEKGISPSWANKWREGDVTKGERFWGSSRWFVMFTDGWHLMQFIFKWCLIIGSVLMYRALNGKLHPVFIVLLIGLLVSVGFAITYQ